MGGMTLTHEDEGSQTPKKWKGFRVSHLGENMRGLIGILMTRRFSRLEPKKVQVNCKGT